MEYRAGVEPALTGFSPNELPLFYRHFGRVPPFVVKPPWLPEMDSNHRLKLSELSNDMPI